MSKMGRKVVDDMETAKAPPWDWFGRDSSFPLPVEEINGCFEGELGYD